MASERTILLTQLDPNRLGERGEKEKRKERGKRRREYRERESTFSLDFSTIGPTNLDEARGKVDLHYKGYAWVSRLWSFDNSGR